MNTKIAFESLVMDLKRVALGYHRGSEKMALRFSEEALKRKEEIEITKLKPYIQRLLVTMNAKLSEKNAEDILMYSTLFQNYTQTYL